MSILVVGSIAFDSVKTTYGEQTMQIGGAANYFSMAARFFSPIKMVGVVGDDYPKMHLDFLSKNNVDIDGVCTLTGKSFHWKGEYGEDVNEAHTLSTELNVFENFRPEIPESYKNADAAFLANIDPEIQIYVLNQMKKPKISALDSMNYWIQSKKQILLKAIKMVDFIFMNDKEVRMLAEEHNIFKAVRALQRQGAKNIIVKRGEYGSMMCTENDLFFMPAFPVEDVVDPTGAGDSFAGGFLGRLLEGGCLRSSLLAGSILSSFTIERFSISALLELKKSHIEERTKELKKILLWN